MCDENQQRGHTEHFAVPCIASVGPPSAGSSPDLGAHDAGEKLYFPCGQWLARDVGDGQVARTLVVSRTDPHDAMQAYMVDVVTSDLRGAGTTAGVSLRLHGDVEVSSVQHLKVGCVGSPFIHCAGCMVYTP